MKQKTYGQIYILWNYVHSIIRWKKLSVNLDAFEVKLSYTNINMCLYCSTTVSTIRGMYVKIVHEIQSTREQITCTVPKLSLKSLETCSTVSYYKQNCGMRVIRERVHVRARWPAWVFLTLTKILQSASTIWDTYGLQILQ